MCNNDVEISEALSQSERTCVVVVCCYSYRTMIVGTLKMLLFADRGRSLTQRKKVAGSRDRG